MKFSALSAIRGLVHLIYPKLCVACQDEPPLRDAPFCLTCHQDMYYTNHISERSNEFEEHFLGRIRLERGAAMFFYRKDTAIQNVMHEFKYKGNYDIGFKLGVAFGLSLKESGFMEGITAIVPVPMHWKKQKKRGYNQAEWFAKGISSTTRVEMFADLLEKIEETESQTRKGRQARVENVEQVFQLNSAYFPENEHILLVDDVLTTGATLEACAKTLDLNKNKVSMVTLAIGRL